MKIRFEVNRVESTPEVKKEVIIEEPEHVVEQSDSNDDLDCYEPPNGPFEPQLSQKNKIPSQKLLKQVPVEI